MMSMCTCSSCAAPQVFSDYLSYVEKYGESVSHLPTTAFWYGLQVGETIKMKMPRERAMREFEYDPPEVADDGSPTDLESFYRDTEIEIKLNRVSPRGKDDMRNIDFTVTTDGGASHQVVQLQDKVASDQFDGPMADASDAHQLGSPIPGAVEGIHVQPGRKQMRADRTSPSKPCCRPKCPLMLPLIRPSYARSACISHRNRDGRRCPFQGCRNEDGSHCQGPTRRKGWEAGGCCW